MTAPRQLIIAIDGPSGAGKGTIARSLARQLGYRHIDTGAMYRAVAWKALHDGVDLNDASAVARVARDAEFTLDRRTAIDGHDVTDAIRTSEIDEAAAIVARHPPVRQVLVARQQQYGEHGGIVMEGRDIGTVVFPSADVKVYLDASPEERARRPPIPSREPSKPAIAPTAREPHRRSWWRRTPSTSTRRTSRSTRCPEGSWRSSSVRCCGQA
jgi:cytidylate kinase